MMLFCGQQKWLLSRINLFSLRENMWSSIRDSFFCACALISNEPLKNLPSWREAYFPENPFR